jgi:hypothetical protein
MGNHDSKIVTRAASIEETLALRAVSLPDIKISIDGKAG